MKTLFHSLLAVALMLSTFVAKAVPIPQSDGLGPKIRITIEVGRRSRDCLRIGVCTISLDRNMGPQSGPNGENTVTGTAWIENGKLKIEFDRASMTEVTYQTHFGTGKFQLEEDYILPSDVASALGIKIYTIKTGKYAVIQTTGESNTVPVTF